MFVPNFEEMSHVILVLEPENYLKNLVKKVGLFKNGLKAAKNISQSYYMS